MSGWSTAPASVYSLIPMLADEIDDLLSRSVALMADGRIDDAVSLLLPALDSAEARADHESASLLACMIASLQVARGAPLTALDFHLRAEAHAPLDRRLQLNTAFHLLDGLDRPDATLEKLQAMASSDPPLSAVERHTAQALAGRAYFRRNETTEAILALHDLFHSMDATPAESCDLYLVAALIERSLDLMTCQRYLDSVTAKLDREQVDNQQIRQRITELRARIPHPT